MCLTGPGPAKRPTFDTSTFFDVAGNVSNPSAQTQPTLAALMLERGWLITDVRVNMQCSLSTSESNTMRPKVDFVWQDELHGDCHAQVRGILERPMRGLLPAF